MYSLTTTARRKSLSENLGCYVAELQIHMTLHAYHLLPNLTTIANSREQSFYETQANFEKLASRQLC
jgi:hypothetical protein